MKLCPPKPGVDRHQQNNVDLVQDMCKPVQRGGGVEDEACQTALITDQREAAIDVTGGFGVKRDDVGAGLGKHRDQAVDGLDHQMHINGDLDVGTNSLTNHGADGQIGNVMVVHHVKMNPVCPCGHNIFNFFSQSGEVRR